MSSFNSNVLFKILYTQESWFACNQSFHKFSKELDAILKVPDATCKEERKKPGKYIGLSVRFDMVDNWL